MVSRDPHDVSDTPAADEPLPAEPDQGETAVRPGWIAPPPAELRTAVGSGPAGSAIKRQSVASERKAGPQSKQLIIGGIVVVVMAVVLVVGLVLNKVNTAIQNDGYGSATSTTATVIDGVIAVGTKTAPVSIDYFTDALCANCGQFERQYGQQIAQAMDEGKLTVRYHLLTYLDARSITQTYSTRAAAAQLCVATNLGPEPGTFSRFHEQLFAQDVQPQENTFTDLSTEQLVDQLTQARTAVGATGNEAAVGKALACLRGGDTAAAAAANTASEARLTQALGGVGAPVVLVGNKGVNTDDVNWLTNLLAS
ncbi:hypothetical protein EH165_09575 [Nakamurella antarctica]|uniref:Thioredoxin-like fold domain-containing protein n=1 Tax=Nakamurella antarctica TaxID=1902245 RepID=A0A3G8ZXH3_9ACTN|nr:thioredoxin domain-containing protein [Nakamurella antarctica]AZI58351.1 hypothetical protein EH165_09575 [Nakamurella antarctica]